MALRIVSATTVQLRAKKIERVKHKIEIVVFIMRVSIWWIQRRRRRQAPWPFELQVNEIDQCALHLGTILFCSRNYYTINM